jgi:hypothetical protein
MQMADDAIAYAQPTAGECGGRAYDFAYEASGSRADPRCTIPPDPITRDRELASPSI